MVPAILVGGLIVISPLFEPQPYVPTPRCETILRMDGEVLHLTGKMKGVCYYEPYNDESPSDEPADK